MISGRRLKTSVYNVAESLLLIGLHTRPAVFSSKALGYYTISVDYFGDVDVVEAADLSKSIRHQKAFKSSERISEGYSGDKLIDLAADFDADRTIVTCSINMDRQVTGNSPEKVVKLKDKEKQLKKVRRLGVKVPEFEVVTDREDAVEVTRNMGFPCVLKPVRGAGGRGVMLLQEEEDIPEFEEKHMIQEFISERPISTSTLSTKKEAIMLSTSEQLLGHSLVGQKDFVYCGNIVPFSIRGRGFDELSEISTKIARTFGVVGWNGIDFILGDEPVFIEINPRFQGTFGCIEKAYNINLLDAHIRACEGELIRQPVASQTAVRMTLFAKERCVVKKDIRKIAVDVPLKNSIVEEGEPITTVLSSGEKEEALRACRNLVTWIYAEALQNFSH
jgi:predicted ATP-grasp superfamily ATP-dependent carboligase